MKKQTGKVTKEADGFKVRFERLLNHDINTVWKAITQPEKTCHMVYRYRHGF